MNIEEIKQAIEQRTGIPGPLLTGETAEEVISTAKALLAFWRENAEQKPKTARDQFSDWFGAVQGIEEPDIKLNALLEIEEAARVDAGGYPRVKDGTVEQNPLPDPRPAAEQFTDWFLQKTAFNPYKEDGWTHMD